MKGISNTVIKPHISPDSLFFMAFYGFEFKKELCYNLAGRGIPIKMGKPQNQWEEGEKKNKVVRFTRILPLNNLSNIIDKGIQNHEIKLCTTSRNVILKTPSLIKRPLVFLPVHITGLDPVRDYSCALEEWWEKEKEVFDEIKEAYVSRKLSVNIKKVLECVKRGYGPDLLRFNERVGNILLFYPYNVVRVRQIPNKYYRLFEIDRSPDHRWDYIVSINIRNGEEVICAYSEVVPKDKRFIEVTYHEPASEGIITLTPLEGPYKGQCIYRENFTLVRQIIVDMQALSDRVVIKNRVFDRYSSTKIISGSFKDDPWVELQRIYRTGEKTPQLNFYFHSNRIEQAREAVRNLIQNHTEEYIYIWDPFFDITSAEWLLPFIQCVSPLKIRIMTSLDKDERRNKLKESLKRLQKKLNLDLECRNILTKGGNRAFHDRFIITKDRAWMLGNSLDAIGESYTGIVQFPYYEDLKNDFERIWNGMVLHPAGKGAPKSYKIIDLFPIEKKLVKGKRERKTQFAGWERVIQITIGLGSTNKNKLIKEAISKGLLIKNERNCPTFSQEKNWQKRVVEEMLMQISHTQCSIREAKRNLTAFLNWTYHQTTEYQEYLPRILEKEKIRKQLETISFALLEELIRREEWASGYIEKEKEGYQQLDKRYKEAQRLKEVWDIIESIERFASYMHSLDHKVQVLLLLISHFSQSKVLEFFEKYPNPYLLTYYFVVMKRNKEINELEIFLRSASILVWGAAAEYCCSRTMDKVNPRSFRFLRAEDINNDESKIQEKGEQDLKWLLTTLLTEPTEQKVTFWELFLDKLIFFKSTLSKQTNFLQVKKIYQKFENIIIEYLIDHVFSQKKGQLFLLTFLEALKTSKRDIALITFADKLKRQFYKNKNQESALLISREIANHFKERISLSREAYLIILDPVEEINYLLIVSQAIYDLLKKEVPQWFWENILVNSIEKDMDEQWYNLKYDRWYKAFQYYIYASIFGLFLGIELSGINIKEARTLIKNIWEKYLCYAKDLEWRVQYDTLGIEKNKFSINNISEELGPNAGIFALFFTILGQTFSVIEKEDYCKYIEETLPTLLDISHIIRLLAQGEKTPENNKQMLKKVVESPDFPYRVKQAKQKGEEEFLIKRLKEAKLPDLAELLKNVS